MSKYSAESGDDSGYFASARIEESRRLYQENEKLRECLRTVRSLIHNLPASKTAGQIDELIAAAGIQ